MTKGKYIYLNVFGLWLSVKTAENPASIFTSTTCAPIFKLTLEIAGRINQMKCDAEPKASYSNLSWTLCFCAGCFSAASPEENTDRGGEGGVCRTRVCTTHVKMTVWTRAFVFFLLPIILSSLLILQPINTFFSKLRTASSQTRWGQFWYLSSVCYL